MSSRQEERLRRRLLYILVLSVLLFLTFAWLAWDIGQTLLDLL